MTMTLTFGKSLGLVGLAGIGCSLALFLGALNANAAEAQSNGTRIDVAQSAACQRCLDKCKSAKLSPNQKKACVDDCYTKSKVCTFDNTLKDPDDLGRLLSDSGLRPIR